MAELKFVSDSKMLLVDHDFERDVTFAYDVEAVGINHQENSNKSQPDIKVLLASMGSAIAPNSNLRKIVGKGWCKDLHILVDKNPYYKNKQSYRFTEFPTIENPVVFSQ